MSTRRGEARAQRSWQRCLRASTQAALSCVTDPVLNRLQPRPARDTAAGDTRRGKWWCVPLASRLKQSLGWGGEPPPPVCVPEPGGRTNYLA